MGASGNDSLHFSDMREVILKMFGDQRSEKVVLNNANNSIKKVNSEIFQQFSMQTRFGILSRQILCGVCKRQLSVLQQDDAAPLDDQEDDDEEMLAYLNPSDNFGVPRLFKLFACRHVFHVSCLKSYYLKKFGTSP
jgi:hypothetical protein